MYCERVAIFSTLVGFISRLGVAGCHAAEACYNVIIEGGETVDVLSLAQVTGGLRLRELLTRLGGDRAQLTLLQVANEQKGGNISVPFAGDGGPCWAMTRNCEA